MKERPIIFTGESVCAILDNRKTQTRRMVKGLPDDADQVQYWAPPSGMSQDGWASPGVNYWSKRGNHIDPCPYGELGDRLWVRESYRFPAVFDKMSAATVTDKCYDAGYRTPWGPVKFEADGRADNPHMLPDFGGSWGKLRRSICMPRWASRLTLEITGIRVERLQAISEADAMDEGFYQAVHEDRPRSGNPREWFRATWDSINRKRAPWDSNPWVWVVTFKRVGAP